MRRRAETDALTSFVTLQDGSDQHRDGDLLFLSVPRQLSASGSLAWTSARLQKSKHAAGAAPVTSVSINQSLLAIASFFLSQLHTQTVSIRDLTRKESTSASNMKRAVLLPPVQTDHGDAFSLITGSMSVCFLPVSVQPPEVLKGKVVVFTPWMLSIFLSNGEKKRNVMWVHFLFHGRSLEDGVGYLYVNFTHLFMISYIVNLFMVQTDLRRNSK